MWKLPWNMQLRFLSLRKCHHCLEGHISEEFTWKCGKTEIFASYWGFCKVGKLFKHYIQFIYMTVAVSAGIKLTKELISSQAIKGEDVVLECLYDLQWDSLYSVKWYHNCLEFYI